jgi:hypothetical protein
MPIRVSLSSRSVEGPGRNALLFMRRGLQHSVRRDACNKVLPQIRGEVGEGFVTHIDQALDKARFTLRARTLIPIVRCLVCGRRIANMRRVVVGIASRNDRTATIHRISSLACHLNFRSPFVFLSLACREVPVDNLPCRA